MSLFPPATVRLPADERLVEIAKLGPSGWWRDHANENRCCQFGEPQCDVGHALSRLAAAELVRRS